MALRGSLKEMSLTSLISVNCNELSRSRLRVESHGREAVLFFEDGSLVHAATGTREGEEAVYDLLSWEEGQFELEMDTPATKHTIHTPWSHLLLDGMSRLDERAAGAQGRELSIRTAPPADSAGTAPPAESAGTVPPAESAGTAPPAESARTLPPSRDATTWSVPADGRVRPQAHPTTASAVEENTWISGATLVRTLATAEPALPRARASPVRERSEMPREAGRSGPRLVLASDETESGAGQIGPRVETFHPGPRLATRYGRDAGWTPADDDVPSLVERAFSQQMTDTGAADGLLERLCRLEGVEGALLVARDGTLLAQRWGNRLTAGQPMAAEPSRLSDDDAAELAGAVVVFVGNAARDMGEALGLGALVSGVVQMGYGRIHILVLEQPECFVGLRLGQRNSPSLVAARAALLLAAALAEV